MSLSLTLTPELAKLLWCNAARNFVAEQDGRFCSVEEGALGPYAPEYAGGTMYWCETASDMVLLAAWERARGRLVTLLTDEEGMSASPYVVLSSQRFGDLR